MTIQIITDSGADIPKQLASELGIIVVPLRVAFGNESYEDGIDLSEDQFYTRLTQEEILPTTSQPSVGRFSEIYRKAMDSKNQILSIHLSSKLSGTLNSATQALTEGVLGENVKLIDSQQVSMGLGLSVILAAEAVRDGASLDEAAAVARSALDRTNVFVLFDTLKYLEKGGRIGRANALVGSLLQIKPILTLEKGEIATKTKVRTFKKGIQRLQQLIEECGPIERSAVLYTTDNTEANKMASFLVDKMEGRSKPLVTRLSPAVGTHGGPGLVGVVCVGAET